RFAVQRTRQRRAVREVFVEAASGGRGPACAGHQYRAHEDAKTLFGSYLSRPHFLGRTLWVRRIDNPPARSQRASPHLQRCPQGVAGGLPIRRRLATWLATCPPHRFIPAHYSYRSATTG